jgi:eukaryotic-like serine/threonine-protein kinase
MSVEESPPDEREQRLDAIIAAYYRAVEAGASVDQEVFIAKNPAFHRELREFFANLGMFPSSARESFADPALEPTFTSVATRREKSAAGTVVRYFGEYEILEELGAGGMGVVYKARQSKLKRIVAIKMIRSGELASAQDVQRFEAEAKAAARLSHPGIVTVHEVGIHHGQHFYTMDYVEGGSLSQLHRDKPIDSRRAATLVRGLAESMSYAHEQGVVHRDLKPANILLTTEGVPRITDFGLAKRMRTEEESHAPTMTESGQILGTAGYMSPEQAAGKSQLVGPPADIYSLGAVLYALLTSRAPFTGETPSQTILQVLQNEPVSPRALNTDVPRDLETICLKCLQKEPHKRYGTAQGLADDLTLFLARKPVHARPVSSVERSWRWCRRNAVLASLCVILFMTLLLGSGISWYYKYLSDRRADANFNLAREERHFRNLAEQRKHEAERSRSLAESRLTELRISERESRRHLYCAHMSLIQNAWDKDDEPGGAQEIARLLERQVPGTGQEDLRSFEWHYWHRRINDELFNIIGQFRAVSLDPHGTLIATGGRDKTVRLWDAATGAAINEMKGHNGEVCCLAYSKDGKRLVSGSWDETIRVWDAKSAKEAGILVGHSGPVLSVAVLPDGKMAASGSMDGTARVWDLNSMDTLAVLGTPAKDWTACAHVAFGDDGKTLAFAQGNTLEIWDVKEKEVTLRFKLKADVVFSDVCISPDSTKLVTGDNYGMLRLWDSKTGYELLKFKAHVNAVQTVEFSPDGGQMASSANFEDIRISDTLSGEKLSMLKGNRGGVGDLKYYPSGATLACVCLSHVRILNATSDSDSAIPALNQFSGSMAFSADSRLLAIGDRFGDIALLGLDGGRDLRILKGGELSPQQKASKVLAPIVVTFHPSGEFVVTGSPRPDWSIRFRSVHDHEAESVLTGHEDAITEISVSPDGSTIASASVDRTIKLWNTATKELIRTLRGHSDSVTDLAFSNEGQLLASASNDGCVKVWDTDTGAEIRSMNGAAPGGGVAFSPSGNLMAAGFMGEVRIWDCDFSKAPVSIAFHGPIYSVAFTPDGKRVAACGNGPIKLWDTTTGGEVLTILTTAWAVTDIAFSPDGTLLAASKGDSVVLAWEATARSFRGLGTNKSISETRSRAPDQNTPSTVLQSRSLIKSGPRLTSVHHSRDGTQILIGGHDRLASLLRVSDGETMQVFRGHENVVWSVALAPDGTTAVTGSEDKTLRLWDVESGKELDRFDAGGIFSCVRYSSDGMQIVATNWDGKVRIWQLADGTLGEPVQFPFESATLDIVSLTNDTFAFGNVAGSVLMWNARTRNIERTFSGHTGWVHSVASLNNGNQILSASHDSSINLWNADSDTPVLTYSGHRGVINEVRRLPGEKHFLSCGSDRTLRLWGVDSAIELARGFGTGELRGLSVASDGKSCVTAGLDGSLSEWELPNLPDKTANSTPKLLSPEVGAILSNGISMKTEDYTWTFDWADVTDATRYHLVVNGATASIAVIDRSDIPASEWKFTRKGFVSDAFLRNWTWKVRAFVNGDWAEWSDTRTFHVEAAR